MHFRHTLVLLAAFIALLLFIVPASAAIRYSVQTNSSSLSKLERLFGTRMREFNRPARTSSLPVILVTKTADSGPGSLRQALIDANSHIGGDSIVFNIPKTDPGYNASAGVWTIKPLTSLPTLTDDGTVIDGESQALFSPGSNPLGPAIELDGSEGGIITYGITISCSWTFVHRLAVNHMSAIGIYIYGPSHSFNLIDRCYIGVTPDGKQTAPNLGPGIMIMETNLNFISWPDSTLTSFANVIGGNDGPGIRIEGTASTLNYIGPNCIGTDLTCTENLGNTTDGILITGGAADNAIMNFDDPQYIVIRNNGQAGIRVSGGETLRNLLAAGSITNNGGPGILLEKGGNGLMASPIITSASVDAITATALPFSLVAFYRDPADEGEEFLGNAYADASGNVTYHGWVNGPYLTAIAIDTTTGGSKNNTSAFSQPFYYQSEILVTNTNDEGRGSYRSALISANSNPGPDIIKFAIPANDPGYNAQLGTWTIKPTGPFPTIMDRQTIIYGGSQAEFMGYDVNPYGPEIELDGSLVTNATGVFLNQANGSSIDGLIIGRFDHSGITVLKTDSVWITGCYIGTDARGLQAAPNYDGIVVTRHASNVFVMESQGAVSNLISGNTHFGVQIVDSSSTNHITGNIIGLNRTRTQKLGNGSTGIDVGTATTQTEITGNWIGGNSRGIEILNGSNYNIIDANLIGTDTTCKLDLGNTQDGIVIGESEQNTVRDNHIAFNGGTAVMISGASAICNRLSRNWICHHGPPAIVTYGGGNAERPCPVITSFSGGVLTGTAQANDFIEAFSDSSDEGEFFLGFTTAGADGHWSMTQLWPLRGPFITATATDANGNTSCFSAPFDRVAVGVPTGHDEIPGTFALEQNYPNPFNPSTNIKYTVGGTRDSGPALSGAEGLGTRKTMIVVYDVLGRQVSTLINEEKAPGSYEVNFDGSGLASGVYVYQLTAGSFVQSRKMILVK